MIKLIASDLDGTLVRNETQTLSSEILDLIMKLKEKGVHFIAASGRQYASMYDLFGPIRDEISYITENGSLCIHGDEILKRGVLDRSLSLEIMEDIKKREHCELLLSCEDTYYVESEKLLRHMSGLKSKVTKVADASKITKPFLKIAVYDEVNPAETARWFTEKYGARTPVATSGNVWFDFIVPGANKGTALQVFLDYYQIKPEECMAFGDQQNDIEMLALAGESYAMETAAASVSDYAKYTTPSVERVLRSLLASM